MSDGVSAWGAQCLKNGAAQQFQCPIEKASPKSCSIARSRRLPPKRAPAFLLGTRAAVTALGGHHEQIFHRVYKPILEPRTPSLFPPS
eukprot:302418-Chlamydomonas_euryale.AAC.1